MRGKCTGALCFWRQLSPKPSAPTRPSYARMVGPAPAHALCCWGQLARTTSALAGPRCAKVPRTVYDQACAAWGTCLAHQRGLAASGCLDQHRLMPCVFGGTSLAQHRYQWCLGSPRCLEHSRHMLVLLGHLSCTPSAPARPWCARMPGPA